MVTMASRQQDQARSVRSRLERDTRYATSPGDRQLHLTELSNAFAIARLQGDAPAMRSALSQLQGAPGAAAPMLWGKAFQLAGTSQLFHQDS